MNNNGEEPFKLDLVQRLRRLRKSHSIRRLTQENWVNQEDLIQPLFVVEGKSYAKEVRSMPGIKRFSIDKLIKECEELSALEIQAVALFPAMISSSLKDPSGKEALNPKGLIFRAIKAIKKQVPELTVITDIALDSYTSHGHDGVLTIGGTDVDNDRTVEVLCQMASIHADAGVDFVAPSDMMDGRVAAIRSTLDQLDYTNVGIISYSAKFDSAFYGPYRDAIGSFKSISKAATFGKATYQLNPANRREALNEARSDETEGADILMVKPAGCYLDIIREIRNNTDLPIAAYQVSGEYSMMYHAAHKGFLDLKRARDESLLAIKRAGADMIFTYFAKEIAYEMKSKV